MIYTIHTHIKGSDTTWAEITSAYQTRRTLRGARNAALIACADLATRFDVFVRIVAQRGSVRKLHTTLAAKRDGFGMSVRNG